MVLERKPPSPSIQTSGGGRGRSVRGPCRKREEALLTLCLDLVALGESEELGEEVGVVGHDGVEQGCDGGGMGGMWLEGEEEDERESWCYNIPVITMFGVVWTRYL